MSASTVSPEITPDMAAAHQFLTELRTRIATQPLPYQHGDEARALESMWEVFGQARTAMKENPGCKKFAASTTAVLNVVLRPFTAKWHRAAKEGRLAGRDGADEFRGDLQAVQTSLRRFAAELHQTAYGESYQDALTPDAMPDAEVAALFEDLAYGFRAPAADMNETAAAIAEDEAAAVESRREGIASATEAGRNAVGLALSGGGIRSGTFCLGVVQSLAQKGLLREVDFLSTVSGGGYTGSFLTQRLGHGEDHGAVAAPHGPDPEPIRYLRQRARFLSGNNLKQRWSMVTATLAGLLLNWTTPLFLIAALALVATFIPTIPWHRVEIVCSALCCAAVVAYGIGMRRGRKASAVTGGLLGLLLAIFAVIGIGYFVDAGYDSARENWETSGGFSALLALVAAAVPGMVRFLPILKNPTLRKLVLKVALVLAGFLVPLIVVLLFYTACGLARDHFAVLAWITVGLAVVTIFVVNINLTAPHRLYRDGLARTFIQTSAKALPDVKLKEINPAGSAPYHIINAALNVPSSESPALKDRGCDFFMFSKHWTGSTSVGYQRTEDWKANGTDVDLATAMAVSGAAVSSYMGLGSMPSLTALLTLLNVRLGFWIKRPDAARGFATPGFLCLLRETLGLGMSERAAWLNLSDGGHIENLGVYELLRRRCKFIICVDGEADPTFTFHGLMTLVRHAQIDFGVRINPRLDDVRCDPATGYSKSHFHLCRIHYPEGVGMLLYIKLSVTGDESELIGRYRRTNTDFPHQTTLDQFFDQEQFEAYRQLGIHAAEGLFLPALMNNREPTSIPEWFRELAKNLLQPDAARCRSACS